MIYRGFNQREISKISEILDRNNVEYQVGVPDEAMEHINDKSKRVNHRFMDNLLQVEIETTQFDKITPADIQKLFDLRIYKEVESPFTEEELAQAGTETEIDPRGKTNPEHTKMNKWAALLTIGGVAVYALLKSGIFK